MKRICVVTGTRAEYGLLKPVIERIHRDKELELYLVVTGMHLSVEFGLTYREIEADGYKIDKKIEMLLSADTPASIIKSMGVEMIGLADAFEEAKPDMLVALGDRYEMLAAAAAAMVHRIPIAHIHGGELTEGIMDEAVRHSITKMSALHFTATEEYKRRVIQLGERPESVFHVGSLGVEGIRTLQLIEKNRLEELLGFRFGRDTVMVTFHPVPLEQSSVESQFACLLHALGKFAGLRIIFTKANADTAGRVMNQMTDAFVKENSSRSIAFASMGQLKYLSALKYCKAVIGNSSSGIIEAPSFGIPTVDIGDRQKGRMKAESIIHCSVSESEIEQAIKQALSADFQERCRNVRNPYEGKGTSDTIVRMIKKALEHGIDLKKSFYDIRIGS